MLPVLPWLRAQRMAVHGQVVGEGDARFWTDREVLGTLEMNAGTFASPAAL